VYGFDNNKFYIDLKPCTHNVGSTREEFKIRSRFLDHTYKNLILSHSGGTDSQATFRAFYDEKIPVTCAFLHMPGYNDNEHANVLAQKEKYNFDLITVTIDPYAVKDDVMQLSTQLDIPPNQILHSKFLSQLPTDSTFIEGFDGPDLYVKDKKFYLFESANSVEYARLRAYDALNVNHTVVKFNDDEHILLSILKDDIVQAALHAWNYYSIDGLSYLGEEPISIINYWDLFIKPMFFRKHWKYDIDYYPKYQGCEKIDYIINGPEHKYRENQIFLEISQLIQHLHRGTSVKRYWQRSLSQ